ncbi:MAG: hypothetical protein JWQ65_3107 [Devosia sp.]|nr:hypothetical protein [Devosia sp.]
MTVRITFRGPEISEHEEQAGNYQQQSFPDLATTSDWIALHIPETERRLVKMWIDDIAITGATLEASLRPLPAP